MVVQKKLAKRKPLLDCKYVSRKSSIATSFVLIVILCGRINASACSPSDTLLVTSQRLIDNFSKKMLLSVNDKYSKFESKMTGYQERSLASFKKQERKLQRKLAQKDSMASKAIFANSHSCYDDLLKRVQDPSHFIAATNGLNHYLPRLDSLETSFRFMQKMEASIPAEKMEAIRLISARLKQLQAQVQNAADVRKVLAEREKFLKEALDKWGLGKELRSLNKQVYYYQQQVNEYKEMLNDPDKIARKALSLLRDVPAFKDFFSKNSFLAQLFPIPGGYGTAAALSGLQTRMGLQQQLSQRLVGVNTQQYIQQQVQAAQSGLNALKDKVNKLGGGSSELEMPDFKPNSQKTKSFWKRMEYGLNIQSQKSSFLLPTTSDIAITMGYKFNDKTVIGIGAGYKLGWGKSISNIHLTSQGVSLRSYLDLKIKGSLWVSGGYEANYQQEFAKIEQLKDLNAWQRSGLIGLTKKYKIAKKKGNLQLLWDFLSYDQRPQTAALKFRVGYTL